MCYRQNGAFGKFVPDRLLNQLIGSVMKTSEYETNPIVLKMIFFFFLDSMTYWGSTLAVASSRTRIRFFLKIARAKQSNCRCPTLKLLP